MPRVKSAASFARERLQTGKDITPKERLALLKIISIDDRQKKQLQRAKMHPSVKPAPKVAKTNKRDTSEDKARRVLGPDAVTKQKQSLENFLSAVRNPEHPSAPVADSVAAESVEPTTPVANPAPAVIPIQVDKYQY
jgi:hypothetical protein